MIKHVFLFFIPGSAGNFVSRCLNLVDENCHCWATEEQAVRSLPMRQRQHLLCYTEQKQYKKWTDFEHRLELHTRRFLLKDLPDNSVSIWPAHPDYAVLDRGIAGSDDQSFVFYIDPSDNMEWVVLNALYKDSFINRQWLEIGEKMRLDSEINKINLTSIIDSATMCCNEIQRICDLIGQPFSDQARSRIIDLWQQWRNTTLAKDRFVEFQKQIGFNLRSNHAQT